MATPGGQLTNSKSEGDLKNSKTEGGERNNLKNSKTDEGAIVVNPGGDTKGDGGELVANPGGSTKTENNTGLLESPGPKMSDTENAKSDRYRPIIKIPQLEDFNDFETWTKCVSAWSLTCNIPKQEQGFWLTQEIPASSKRYGKSLREDIYKHHRGGRRGG